MAAATLNEVLDALAAHLTAQLDDVYVYARWEGSCQFPALIPYPPSIDKYHQTFSKSAAGIRLINLELWLLVGSGEGQPLSVAQQTTYDFADWAGSRSVYAAVNVDPTLGGEVGECVVDRFDPITAEESAAVGYVGGKFQLTINAVR